MNFDLDQCTFVTSTISPYLLTVPHDGLPRSHFPASLPSRQQGVTVRDMRTWPIAQDIAREVPVNSVRGLLPRTFVDYNRGREEAYEEASMSADYDHYHHSICSCVEGMRESFPAEELLLLDIHGFGEQPPYAPAGGYDLILGTGNGTTILHGQPDQAFADFMTSKGYTIFLPARNPIRATGDWFDGGHTIRWHAAAHEINCMQIEIAPRFRARGAETLGKQLASAIAHFLREVRS